MQIIRYVMPILTGVIIIYALIKKRPIYDDFIDGVNEGLNIVLKIFPSIFAMVVGVSLFLNSNFLNDLLKIINISFFPKELLPLAMLRPISGSSSLMILNDIIKSFGVDSKLAIIASIITASTDTTIYIIATYFGSVNIKKIRYALVVGLIADLSCIIISYLLIK